MNDTRKLKPLLIPGGKRLTFLSRAFLRPSHIPKAGAAEAALYLLPRYDCCNRCYVRSRPPLTPVIPRRRRAQGHDMIEFVREHVVRYLDDDEVHTRREAAVTCCRLLKTSVAGAGVRLPREGRPLGPRRKRVLVEDVLERLLVAAVADADEGVRRAVLLSLPEGAGFEENLAQADSLRAVFIALNDEVRKGECCQKGELPFKTVEGPLLPNAFELPGQAAELWIVVGVGGFPAFYIVVRSGE